MRIRFGVFLAAQLFVFSTAMMFAQSAVEESAAPVLHAQSQLVVVDVTVEDKDGHPVHGLKREDFALTEGSQSQSVSSFEEHSIAAVPEAGPEMPPMPPGTFTDYTPVPPSGALNILLLDTLNTPMADQSYVRSELREYIKKAKPGTRIAIFGLSQRLFLLQGFSSDPQILKDVVEHKLTPRGSSLLNDAFGSGAEMGPTSGVTGIAASNMQQFEAEQRAFQTQMRLQYTMDAFNDLAHYLSAFPGRKNIIWFSGAFPLNILPDPELNNPFAVMENNNAEFRETTNLLARAQVAVYPVDARALRADPTFSSAVGKGDPLGKRSGAFYVAQNNDHMTMSQLAEDTGGKAFYDTNDLASAVQNAVASGSNYYTLTYAPISRNDNGPYRKIRVALAGNLADAKYSLSYRHGYYVDDQRHLPTVAATDSSAATGSGYVYARAAMAHGAPTPQDILFKVRVLPVGTAPETTLATNNETDPTHPIKPPFRRFAVDLAVVSADFQLLLNKDDGRRTGTIEFIVRLYDNDGVPLNATGKVIQLDLTPDSYKQFAAGVNAHFEISVPAKGDADFLRIGVQDVTSNRFGVVEVPIASVAHLTPLPDTQPLAQTQQTQQSPAAKQ